MELSGIIILALAIGFAFILQTIVGFGGGLVSLPIILLFFDLPEAIAFLSIFLALFSVGMVYKTHDHIDRSTILELGMGILIGLPIGIYLLQYGNPEVLKKILGVVIVLYVIQAQFKKRTFKTCKGSGPIFGVVSGLFSGLYATGGPIVVTYINNKVSKKKYLRATIIGVLAITNIARVPMLAQQKILTLELFKISLYIIPVFLLSMWIGQYAYEKANEEMFKKILLGLLLIEGIMLIIK